MNPGCGCQVRRFTSELLAEKALAKSLTLPGSDPGLKPKACPRIPGVWHLVATERHETFPPAVAAQVMARDPWCVFCGSPKGLQLHHRRIRGMGGDPRPHTSCSCVGVRLCARCHSRIHDTEEGRLLAEAEGLIIPRVTAFPGSLSVLVHTEGDAGGMTKWPSCDGRWLDYAPTGAVA